MSEAPQNGPVQKQHLTLEGDTLGYLRARLLGQPVPPPISARSDEEPQDYLFRRYLEAGAELSGRMEEAVVELLLEAERGPVDPDLFSRLLDFIERTRIPVARPHLVCLLLKDPAWMRTTPGLYRNSLLLHVLGALKELGPTGHPEFWLPFLTQPGLAAAAFAGLVGEGLEVALRHLATLVQTAAGHRDRVPLRKSLLLLFIKGYTVISNHNLVIKIFRACIKLGLDERRFLLEEMRALPVAREVAEAKRVWLVREDACRAGEQFVELDQRLLPIVRQLVAGKLREEINTVSVGVFCSSNDYVFLREFTDAARQTQGYLKGESSRDVCRWMGHIFAILNGEFSPMSAEERSEWPLRLAKLSQVHSHLLAEVRGDLSPAKAKELEGASAS